MKLNDRLAAFALALVIFLACRPCLAADPSTAPSPDTALWLTRGERPAAGVHLSLLGWELYRQAVLIAARDELGLQTRDESLREWRDAPPPARTLSPGLDGQTFVLRRLGQSPASPQPAPLWRSRAGMAYLLNFPPEIDALVEKLSRTDFPDILRAQGWHGKPLPAAPDAPAPPETESLLPQLDELSQFAVLRLTHAAIASSGESPARLGVLVRAYANLGQLTRYHWSVDSRVYTARSLLYAQRMVAEQPKSPLALWHRAYARAMAGFSSSATVDLLVASSLKGPPAPPWVALLDPFCKYQTGKLTDLATADPQNTSLGMYMAFLTVENSGCQSAAMNFAQAALKVNPSCLRLIDAMCDQSGPGLLNDLTETGPQVFGQLLGGDLEKMPALPHTVIDLIHNLRRAEGNPEGREQVCQLLIDEGAADKDSGEPSWAALGRQIQETTFAHVQRRANLIAVMWGIDASDYAAEVRPLIADHPCKGLIEAYGLVHGPDQQGFRNALNQPPLDWLTISALPFFMFDRAHQTTDPSSNRVMTVLFNNLDYNAWDIERIFTLYGGATDAYLRDLVGKLQIASDSPWLLVNQINEFWDPKAAVKWEAQQGDFPSIAFALAQKYAELKQWPDAERCYKRYISVSPDQKGYLALADVYLKQGDEAQWLKTLNEFLQQPDYGLEHAQVQVQIAQHYMAVGNYQAALPYADSAAETAAGWAMECDATVHASIGDFDGAEKLITDDVEHYSLTPYIWYAWCLRTGHGQRDAAAAALHSYLDGRGAQTTDDDRLEAIAVDIAQGDDHKAIEILRQRLAANPGPISELHIAMLGDDLNDPAMRDDALKAAAAMPDKPNPLPHLAVIFQNALVAGPDAPPDLAAVDALAKSIDQPEFRVTTFYLTAQYLAHHGQKDKALDYLRKCMTGSDNHNYFDLVLADDALRHDGIEPMDLERAATANHLIYLGP